MQGWNWLNSKKMWDVFLHDGHTQWKIFLHRKSISRSMHVYGNFEIAQTISVTCVTKIMPNQIVTRPVTLAGHVDNGGACSRSAYSDSWTDVVVLANIKITLQDYIANIRLNSNHIQLRSGMACGLSHARCTEGGHTFWEPMPTDFCKFSDYNALYQGYADKIIDNTSEISQINYSLTTQNTIFTLTSINKFTRIHTH